MNKLFITSAVLASTSACFLAVNPVNSQNIAATVTATGRGTLIGGFDASSQRVNFGTSFNNITVGAAVNLSGDGSAFSNSTISSTSLQNSFTNNTEGEDNRSLYRSDIASSTAVANSWPLSSFAVAIGLTGEAKLERRAPNQPDSGVLGENDIDIDVLYEHPSSTPEPGANIAATVAATGSTDTVLSGNIDLARPSSQIETFYDTITVGAAINADGTGSAISNSTISSTSTTNVWTLGGNDGIRDNSSYESDIASSTAAANPRAIDEFFVSIGTFGEGGLLRNPNQGQLDVGVEGDNDSTISVGYD